VGTIVKHCFPLYFPAMSSRLLPAGFIAPGLPTKAPRPPCGDLWLHEIKHERFRIIARKDGGRVPSIVGRAMISPIGSP
jgi:hypothetical protein